MFCVLKNINYVFTMKMMQNSFDDLKEIICIPSGQNNCNFLMYLVKNVFKIKLE